MSYLIKGPSFSSEANKCRAPIREPAGGQERALGTGIDSGEDGRVPLAQARGWWDSSNAWNGQKMGTCGTPGLLRSGKIRAQGVVGSKICYIMLRINSD
jgi:hypothetical protein